MDPGTDPTEEMMRLVKKEKRYAARIMKNLIEIQRGKIFRDFGHPSFLRYLTDELEYSKEEARHLESEVNRALRGPGAPVV